MRWHCQFLWKTSKYLPAHTHSILLPLNCQLLLPPPPPPPPPPIPHSTTCILGLEFYVFLLSLWIWMPITTCVRKSSTCTAFVWPGSFLQKKYYIDVWQPVFRLRDRHFIGAKWRYYLSYFEEPLILWRCCTFLTWPHIYKQASSFGEFINDNARPESRMKGQNEKPNMAMKRFEIQNSAKLGDQVMLANVGEGHYAFCTGWKRIQENARCFQSDWPLSLEPGRIAFREKVKGHAQQDSFRSSHKPKQTRLLRLLALASNKMCIFERSRHLQRASWRQPKNMQKFERPADDVRRLYSFHMVSTRLGAWSPTQHRIAVFFDLHIFSLCSF